MKSPKDIWEEFPVVLRHFVTASHMDLPLDTTGKTDAELFDLSILAFDASIGSRLMAWQACSLASQRTPPVQFVQQLSARSISVEAIRDMLRSLDVLIRIATNSDLPLGLRRIRTVGQMPAKVLARLFLCPDADLCIFADGGTVRGLTLDSLSDELAGEAH